MIVWLIANVHPDTKRYYRRWALLPFLYPRNLALMAGIEEHPPVVKLKRFTRGYYAFSIVGEYVAMTDLRMGSEPDYVFRFKVARSTDSHPTPIDDERLRTNQDWRRLAWVWIRIWNVIP